MPRVIKDDSSDEDEVENSLAKMARSVSPARSVGTSLADITNSPHRMPPLIPGPIKQYADTKEEFERTHAKVGFEYVKVSLVNGCRVVVRYSDATFGKLYKHVRCEYEVKNKKGEWETVQSSFIVKWMNDHTIRNYSDFGIYPDPYGLRSSDNKCPDGVYNLWTPFRAESIVSTQISDSNQAERVQNLATRLSPNT